MDTTRDLFGLKALTAMFDTAKTEGRSAFLPYFPIGFPTYDDSIETIYQMSLQGVDGFEIGIPFSDPLADGPAVQMATQIALENGTTVRKCLQAVRTLRARGVTQPMMMMSYVNPLVAYGTRQFVIDAKAAGADGLIVPDLPVDEAHFFAEYCTEEGMALVFMVAPTSTVERIDLIAQYATGFIYVVSLVGVTGTRTDLPEDLKETIARIRSRTDRKLVLGFGISTPAHVQQINHLVDGFIVGSAIVRKGLEGVDAVRDLTKILREAL